MSQLERGAMVLVPVVAVATLALGLRMGASPAVRAAVLYAAPPSADRAGLAWQLVTLVDDRGVRESISLPEVSVVARAGAQEARWEGSTNSDGVAEVWLPLAGLSTKDAIAVEVRAPHEKAPLATGFVAWPLESMSNEAPSQPMFARPSKQDGEILLDVAVYAGRLVPGFLSRVEIRARERATGRGLGGVTIDSDPEPGLSLDRTRATTNAEGWASLEASAEIHVVALGLHATWNEGALAKKGEWYGALPVAPGAAYVAMPQTIVPGEAHAFEVVVPTVLPRIYVEVDDAVGRAFASSVPVEVGPLGPRARFEVRPLAPGDYWLVTSGSPRAAETLEGSAVARPFVVASPEEAKDSALETRLATLAPPSFPRFVALDGLVGKRRADGGRHRRGLALAFGSLVIAAALETLLILRGVERSRREIHRMAAMLDEQTTHLERRFSATSVIIGILLAVLGFALLAALLSWKAS